MRRSVSGVECDSERGGQRSRWGEGGCEVRRVRKGKGWCVGLAVGECTGDRTRGGARGGVVRHDEGGSV